MASPCLQSIVIAPMNRSLKLLVATTEPTLKTVFTRMDRSTVVWSAVVRSTFLHREPPSRDVSRMDS